jgi:hypothetical protein
MPKVPEPGSVRWTCRLCAPPLVDYTPDPLRSLLRHYRAHHQEVPA